MLEDVRSRRSFCHLICACSIQIPDGAPPIPACRLFFGVYSVPDVRDPRPSAIADHSFGFFLSSTDWCFDVRCVLHHGYNFFWIHPNCARDIYVATGASLCFLLSKMYGKGVLAFLVKAELLDDYKRRLAKATTMLKLN